jgi:predicted Zn-dependent protease
VAVAAAMGLILHAREARADAALRAGLGSALAARDRGDLATAVQGLESLTREHPGAHAPFGLLGEILYRTGRLEEARAAFARAVAIQPSFTMGHKHLAVIALLSRAHVEALRHARAGRATAPGDLELAYVEARASGSDAAAAIEGRALAGGPRAVTALASLAYEVGDVAGAAALLDAGIARFPKEASLRAMRAVIVPTGS